MSYVASVNYLTVLCLQVSMLSARTLRCISFQRLKRESDSKKEIKIEKQRATERKKERESERQRPTERKK